MMICVNWNENIDNTGRAFYVILVKRDDNPTIIMADFVEGKHLITTISDEIQKVIDRFGKPDKIITGKAETLQSQMKAVLQRLMYGDL